MRNIRYLLFVLVLLLSVGFAAINTNLDIISQSIVKQIDDFDVYFSDARVNGVQDITVVESATELRFSTKLADVGSTYELRYQVTNGSLNYDAYVDVTCIGGNSNVTAINTFDSSTVLGATKSRTGVLLISLDDAAGSNTDISYTCTINGQPVETSVLGEDMVDSALSKCVWEFNDLDTSGTITPGDEYIYCTEAFNVVSSTDDDVTLLAKYTLGTNYRQSSGNNSVVFSNNNGWEYTPGPKEIDIQAYEGPVKTYVNAYVSFFKRLIGYPNINGNLLTLEELFELGCVGSDEYADLGDSTLTSCVNSQYNSWLANGQYWWLRSAASDNEKYVWRVNSTGTMGCNSYNYSDKVSVRPVLTVPMEALNNKKYNPYKIGTEIEIAGEQFNVIDETDTTITMLAKYNLGTNYRQSTTQNSVTFSDTNGWEYTPGPKEIDIQVWSTNPKIYINEYVAFLQEEIGDSTLSGDLITMSKLKELGCILHSDYSYGSSSAERTCTSSPYVDWLSGHTFWTRSAQYGNATSVWISGSTGGLNNFRYSGSAGVRPTITMSKSALTNYLKYPVGKEVKLYGDDFYIISSSSDTVTLLAKNNLDTNYKQNTTQYDYWFQNSDGGWEYTPGPKEIDIQNTDGDAVTALNGYVTYLRTGLGDSTITGDLITMSELKSLGCTIIDDYSSSWLATCAYSKYSSWLVNGQNWWTRSADPSSAYNVWYMKTTGSLSPVDTRKRGYGVRPIITISKELYDKLGLNNSVSSDELIDAQTYCENLGYSSGMLNVQTYSAMYDEYGDISDAVYLCSYSDFESDIVGFNALGEVVYEFISNEQ